MLTDKPDEPDQAAAAGGIDQSLAAQAAAIDGDTQPEAGGAAAAAAPAGPTDFDQEALQLVRFVCAAVLPIWPSLSAVYTADTQTAVGQALGPLMRKYDLDVAKLFARWSPEIGFAMVALPLVVPTVAAIKADRAAKPPAPPADDPVPRDPRTDRTEGGIPDPANLAAKA